MKALFPFLSLEPTPASLSGTQALGQARSLPEPDVRSKREPVSEVRGRTAKAPAPSGTLPQVRTTFERYELKYWVTERTARALATFVAPWLAPDERSRRTEAGAVQRNVSLYLDTRGLRFYEAHLASSPDRIKLRVRGYGDPPTGSAFFEVKRKVKSVSLKLRAVLPMDRVRAVLLGRVDPAECPERDRAHLEQFVSSMLLHRAEPRLLVGCFREAFVGRRAGEDVRMTFDRDIAWQPATGLELRPSPRAWRPLAPSAVGGATSWLGESRVLVELKFRGYPPAWMGEAVARFGLVRESFSKYVTAITRQRGGT